MFLQIKHVSSSLGNTKSTYPEVNIELEELFYSGYDDFVGLYPKPISGGFSKPCSKIGKSGNSFLFIYFSYCFMKTNNLHYFKNKYWFIYTQWLKFCILQTAWLIVLYMEISLIIKKREVLMGRKLYFLHYLYIGSTNWPLRYIRSYSLF